MTRTLSIRMDSDNYKFLSRMTKEEHSDVSKAVRELVSRGRVMLAVERYRKGQASLSRAAVLAGVRVGEFMAILAEFGVESRIEYDDYVRGLEHLQKVL